MKDDEDYYVKDSKIYTKDENGEFTKIFADIDKRGKVKKRKSSDSSELFGGFLEAIGMLFLCIIIVVAKIIDFFSQRIERKKNKKMLTKNANLSGTIIKTDGNLIKTYDNQLSIVEDNQTIIIKVDDYQAKLRQLSEEIEAVRGRRTRLITAICIFDCILLFAISTLLII